MGTQIYQLIPENSLNQKILNIPIPIGTISVRAYEEQTAVLIQNKMVIIVWCTLLEKPAYNQQYLVHAPSHEDPL